MTEQQNQEAPKMQQPEYNVLPQGMQSQFQQQGSEIDLKELINAIWAGKKLIILITFLFAIVSVIYTINQPNIYKATTLLAPAGDSGGGGLSKLAGQFGGLASLAGINLGEGATDRTGIALEVLKSRAFIEAFIEKHKLLVPLMAANNWDQVNNKLIFDKDIYNPQTNEWLRDVSFPKTVKPSNWEAYKEFQKLSSVTKNKETGLISISIEHYSPEVAKQWLTLLVVEINEKMRNQEQQEAQNSIDFLNDKLKNSQLAAAMQSVFYQLIEEQTKTLMLTEVSKEFVFKTIEPANAPEEKAKPRRALICVLITVLGIILSVLFVLIRHFMKEERD